MVTAPQLVAEIRDDLARVDEEIRRHAYLDALADGRVSMNALRAFPGHQYHIVNSDLRSIATLVQRHGHTSARDFFIGMLQGEQAAVGKIISMGRKLGMSEDDLRDYEITAHGFAYATYMGWAALYTSAAEFTAGVLVNFAAWGANCESMSLALRQSYGFSEDDTAFLDAFAQMPSFEDVALSIIEEGLDDGVEPRLIGRAARLFQGFEKMFWDEMAAAANANPFGEHSHG